MEKKANCILTLYDKNEQPSIIKDTFISEEFMQELVSVLSREESILENLEKILKKYSFNDLEGNKIEIKVDDIAGINLPML